MSGVSRTGVVGPQLNAIRWAASPMRYLSPIVTTMPIGCIVVIWGAVGVPISWVAVASVGSAALGIILGRYMSAMMVRNLLHGDSHFLIQRAPGGIWFFVAVGVVGALPFIAIRAVFGRAAGQLSLHVGAVVLGVLFCVVFGTIALVVLRLERTEGKHLYIGHEGFFFVDA